uniref:Vbh-1 n=1 Tax=Arundo donax TaxID=35708 RepID=A0A0A9F576_ARUDO
MGPAVVGEPSEGVEGLEIWDGERRRFDKYDIPVEVSGDGVPAPADRFEAAGLAEAVVRSVARYGYESPTTVQRSAVLIVMAGRNLEACACAQTGSGKAAVFCLPAVSGLAAAGGSGGGRRGRGLFDGTASPCVLFFAPIRELAAQVEATIKEMDATFEQCLACDQH